MDRAGGELGRAGEIDGLNPRRAIGSRELAGERAKLDRLDAQATRDFRRASLAVDPEAVAEELWGEVSHVLGLPPIRPAQMVAHLWRHGLVETHLGETYLFSREHMVGVAGDWCLGRLAEHAFESGNRLGKAIIESLS